jgi:hypothetical protein
MSGWWRVTAYLVLSVTGALVGIVAPTRAEAGPVEDANAVVDRWAETYSANDAAALVRLYASEYAKSNPDDVVIVITVAERVGNYAGHQEPVLGPAAAGRPRPPARAARRCDGPARDDREG